jgi:cytoskeletal protein CcmA (bactofilin family)
MIRMGRGSSRIENTGDLPQFQEQKTITGGSLYPAQAKEAFPSQTRAVSDSESMARDIKEGRLSGFVGSGTVLTGETTFHAMLRIDGHLTGRVSSEGGTLIVGSTGRVDANMLVAAAMINGTVNGDIVASEKVELGRSARVMGNIQTPRLVVEDGAIFEGSCAMIKAKEASENQAEIARTQINAAGAAQAEELPVYVEPGDEQTVEATAS